MNKILRNASIISIATLITLSSILCISGCGTNDNSNSFNKSNNKITATEGFTIEQDDYAYQPYWQSWSNSICKTDDGYYIYKNNFLYYMDNNTNEAIPLCNKVDCDHTGRDCNSYLNNDYTYSISSYNNNLYMFKRNESNDVMLIQYKSDGSGDYTELFKIGEYSKESDDISCWSIVFNNDKCYIYNYYPYNEQSKPVITEYSLDGKESKVVSLDGMVGENLTLASVKSYGNKIFYCLQAMIMDLDTKFSPADEYTGIFVYDINTHNTMQLFKGNNIRDFAVNEEDNTIYYFVTGEGLKMSSLNEPDKDASTILECSNTLDCTNISYDGDNLYMDNMFWSNLTGTSPTLWIFDNTGKEINNLDFSNYIGNPRPQYGDKDKLFIGTDIVVDKADIKSLTISDLNNIAKENGIE